MKAVIQTDYGSADVLRVQETRKPEPGSDEVLVRVAAASLSAGDCFLMRGRPLPARLMLGLRRPKKDYVVGLDFAGVVESLGPNATGFEVGDEVYGECRGSCAEFSVAQTSHIAPKPRRLTFQEASAVPTSACTALQALRDQGKIRPGLKVLINGASGGVGPFAVQLAKVLGAEVTAVCSARNAELVRSLGADHVIDYTRDDFTQGSSRYDVILDNVASHSPSAARRALKPGGIHVPSSGNGGLGWIIRAAIESLYVAEQNRPFEAMTNTEDLITLAQMIDASQLTPVVDRVYGLNDTPEALRYVDQGHARGKVVIDMGNLGSGTPLFEM